MQEVIFNEKNERNCYFAGFYEMSDFIIKNVKFFGTIIGKIRENGGK